MDAARFLDTLCGDAPQLPNLVFYLIVVVHRLYKVFKNAPGIRGAFLREPTWSEGALHLPFQPPEEIATIMLSPG